MQYDKAKQSRNFFVQHCIFSDKRKKTASNLANDPTSILADDPTSNLQPKVRDTSGTQPDYLGRMLLKAPHIVNRAAYSLSVTLLH